MGFLGRGRQEPGPGPQASRLQVMAVDGGEPPAAWLVELTGTGGGAGPARAGQAACTVTGPASGLYQLLWNRGDATAAGVTVSGDGALAQSWRDGIRIRWE